MKKIMYKVLLGISWLVCVELSYAVPATFIAPDQISASVFSITSPGLYVLTDDVSYTTAGGTAITIGSSDVTLDLNGKTIINSGAGVENGVALSTTLTNITIKNGTLRIFDGVGVNIAAGSSDIVLEDVTVIGLNITTGTAFNFAGTSGSALRASGIIMKNCNASSCLHGMDATATDGIRMISSTFNRNGTRGIFVTDCQAWDLDDCQSSFNSSATEGIGIIAVDSTCWSFSNSDFSYNTAGTGIGRGITFQLGSLATAGGHTLKNCTFCRNSSTSSTAIGLDLQSTNSSAIKNCGANGNFSSTSAATGISITGSAVLIDTCITDGNFTSAGVGNARGVQLTGTGHRVMNSQLINNSSAGGDGIGLDLTGTGHLIESCRLSVNAAFGAGVGRGLLMQLASAKILVKNCTAVANTTRGFETLAASGANLFIGNISFAHGVAGANNFVGSIPFLSVAATGPYPLAGSFDNRSLANLSFT